MNKLEEVSKLLSDYRKLNRKSPRLIVLGAESFDELRSLQQSGFVKLWFDPKTNRNTFEGIRVLVSPETKYSEVSFY